MASTMRRQILNSVGPEAEAGAFTSLVKKVAGGGKENDTLKEFYEALNRKQREQLWIDLAPRLAEAADIIESGAQSDGTEPVAPEVTRAISLISATVEMLHAAISIKNPAGVSADMLKAAWVAHDQLFSLGAESTKLRERIAQLCESWWKKSLPGKDQLVPQTISYLLMRSMQPEARKSDVKRVFTFRESLLLIDFTDPSAELLKGALLQCTLSPPFLDTSDGKKFLAYLFCLNLGWIEQLHGTILSTLAVCPLHFVDAYADVYFKAWRSATGTYLERIERCCIQDLMDRTVHAQRSGAGGGLAKRLSRVLDAFHTKKLERGVDEMLVRLYKPIIWRGLRAGNPLVRANAATLLCSAFPLTDPGATRAEQDELMQKQFDTLGELLADEYPVVRLVGVEGVCRTLGVYWELIPKKTLSALLGKLVGNLAADATSAAVRGAVFKGLTYLLDNHLCRPLLKDLLPKMAEMVHDPSERVRRSFYKLLLAVKQIQGIKFYDIVPLDHLLSRLDVESDANAILLVELLQSSYFPLDKSEASRVARCLHMAEAQPRAARVFFRHLAQSIPEDVAGKFIVTVLDTIADSRAEHSADGEDDLLEDFDDEPRSARKEQSDKSAIAEQESAALLEGCALLLGSLSDVLLSAENKSFCKMLARSARAAREAVFSAHGNSSRAGAAVEQVLMYVPATPSQTKEAISSLNALDDSCPETTMIALVDRLCAWEKSDAVITTAQKWLKEAFDPTSSKATKEVGSANRSKKKKKAAASDEPRHVNIALTCLNRVLLTMSARGEPLPVGPTQAVIRTLGMAASIVENRIGGSDTTRSVCTEQLLRALELQFKFTVFLSLCSKDSVEDEDTGIEDICMERITWTKQVLLPFQPAPEENGVARKSARKRKTAEPRSESSIEIRSVTPFVSALLVSLCETLKVCGSSPELTDTMESFMVQLLDTEQAKQHALAVGKVLCEMVLVGGTSIDAAMRIIPEWLYSASADEVSLAAIRPVLTSIAKDFQRRRKLLKLIPVIGSTCARVAEDGNVGAVDFFASHLTRTEVILDAFVSGLDDSFEKIEANLRLLTNVSDSVTRLTESGAQTCSLQSVRAYAESAISRIQAQGTTLVDDLNDEAQESAADDMETDAAAPSKSSASKETSSQKRKRQLALAAVSVSLNEKKMELESLVEAEQFNEAAEMQEAIMDLETEKRGLQTSQSQIAPESDAQAESPRATVKPTSVAQSLAEHLLSAISAE